MFGRALRVLAVLMAVLLLAAAAAVLYVRSAAPQLSGTLTLGGLEAPVDVWRDSLGVPHIRAQSERDLLFAQGCVHAQDRLWQMDLLRRAGTGRLSELFGSDLLESDRFLRVLGMARAAQRDAAALGSAERALLEAYADGVNACTRAHAGALPPEYLVLRARPEPWTVEHSLVIAYVMAFDLSLYYGSAQATEAAARIGAERAALLTPIYPEWGPTIVASAPVPAPAPALALLDAGSIARASNAWVIGGAHTRSGKPILANDMHLALRAPSLWYLAALHAPGLAVTGVTLPGLPYVIAGHNRAIAWGFTNAMLDDADLFLEQVDPADSTRYLLPGGSAPFEVLVDTIRVRDAEPVVLRHRRTRNGPVLSDVQPALGTLPVALRWAAHDPATSLDAVRALNLADDWESFRAAVAAFDNPHQNVVYADTAGHIGYAMAGRIPRRGAEGRRPPTLPVPGWTGEWDWQGYLPDAEHPAVLDPPRGWVVTANNRQAAGPLAERISGDWETPFRATRIGQLVESARAVDANAVHRMQLDVGDVAAARYAPVAADVAARLGATDEARLLRAWDHYARAESEAAALFYVWYSRLRPRLAETLYGDTSGYLPRPLVDRVLELGTLPWDSVNGAAAYDSAAALAWRDALAIARGRSWGALHAVRAGHPFGDVAFLQRIFRFSLDGPAADGSSTTVNVLHHLGAAFPVTAQYGASQRHVVDMADVDASGGFILPTGQSGLPFAQHYRDQFARWRRGGLWRIPLAADAAEARVVQRLRLEPGNE